MVMATGMLVSMVRKSKQVKRRIKILVWGGWKTGKSRNSLMMPGPCLVLDVEKKSDVFANLADFFVVKTRNVQAIKQLLNELRLNGCQVPVVDDDGNPTGEMVRIESIIVDSGTTLGSLINDAHYLKLKRAPANVGNPSFRMEPTDYALPKAEYREIVNILLDLDVYVYFICREKVNYLPFRKGEFMKINTDDPTKADIDAGAPYDFDVILQTIKTRENGVDKYQAIVRGSCLVDDDGTQLLPEVIDNIDPDKFIPELIELGTKAKRLAPSQKVQVMEGPRNVTRTIADVEIDTLRKSVKDTIAVLGWPLSKASDEMFKLVGVKSTQSKDFTVDKAQTYLDYLQAQLPTGNASDDGHIDTPTDDVV